MSEEYRVEIKVKNNNIIKKIEDAGYKTINEICRLNPDISKDISKIGELVNFRISPLSANGDFRPVVYRLADTLNCSPEDLFSDIQLTTAIATNKRTFQVNEAEMQFMLASNPDQKLLEDIVAEKERDKAVLEMVETLTPREQKVLNLRFGLNGCEEHTLEECSTIFDVNRERVRQIEAKALRKLRHSSRSDTVRDFVRINP